MNEKDILELLEKGKKIKNTKVARRPVVVELSHFGCKAFRIAMRDSRLDQEDWYKIGKDKVVLRERPAE